MHKSDIKDNILYIQSQEMLKKFLLFLKVKFIILVLDKNQVS